MKFGCVGDEFVFHFLCGVCVEIRNPSPCPLPIGWGEGGGGGVAAVGVEDDSFDDTGALAKLAGAAVEVLAAG